MGRDHIPEYDVLRLFLFQSTRPVWGATQYAPASVFPRIFQSTRPVWGATAPATSGYRNQRFQSTRPVWGATDRRVPVFCPIIISIHAPRVGRDIDRVGFAGIKINFNPRAPCGARPSACLSLCPVTYFNPRAPCGARLSAFACSYSCSNFNPRAPCGARHFSASNHSALSDFNPRAPCGARHFIKP